MIAPRHLYVHVPFCSGACVYCAFHSDVAGVDMRRAYAAALPREWDLLAARERWSVRPELDTVYFGGGTPGMLGAAGLAGLVRAMRSRVTLADDYEWTVELHPAIASKRMCAALRTAGVNRLSFGVQSFDDAVLRAMGRRHTAADAVVAVARAREVGFDAVGIDLIAGLPGVDEAGWRATLARTAALDLPHVSVYALSVEPGSALAAAGAATIADETMLRALDVAERELARSGLVRYEISNYARPGSACRHNLACWRGLDYAGFGPGAASRLGRSRWTNRPDTAAWLAAVQGGRMPPACRERVSADEDVLGRLLFGLRLDEGIDLARFVSRYPTWLPVVARWEERLVRHADVGIVTGRDGCWRLTARGREVADAVMADLCVVARIEGSEQ